jgi:hypothetical protein
MPAFEKITFKQSLSFKRHLQFEVESNRDLHMHYKSVFKTQTQTFPLDIVSPRPGLNKTINLGAGIAALVLLLMIGFCFIGYVQNPARFENPLVVITSIFLPPALIALWFFNASFTPYVVFFRADDGEELFKIRQQKDDIKAIANFANVLTDRIESIRYPTNLSLSEQMELYQKHLEFLLGEEVLTQKEYDNIIQRVQDKRTSTKVFKLV